MSWESLSVSKLQREISKRASLVAYSFLITRKFNHSNIPGAPRSTSDQKGALMRRTGTYVRYDCLCRYASQT